MTPLVSSSSSIKAHRIGFTISIRLHPQVTKLQSVNRRSRQGRNGGLSPGNFTGIAISLYFIIAHQQVIIIGVDYSDESSSDY